MASVWRCDVYALNGALVVANLPLQEWSVTWTLGDPGALEGTMYLGRAAATIANLDPGARELRVYRDNVLVWGGYLWQARISRKDKMMTISGMGYFSRLMKRILWAGLLQNDRDTADIAWKLIDQTQTSDGTFGITDAHVNSGFIVDRYYCMADKNVIGDAIKELSEMDNSFDFWITPTMTDTSNKVFKTAAPRVGSVKGVTFDGTNAIEDDYTIDAFEIENRIWGEGQGDCNPPSFEAKANGSIARYGELHGTVDFEDLDHFNSVKAHTREELRNKKVPLEQPELDVAEQDYTWGSLEIGDVCTLTRPASTFDSGSHQYRLIEFQVHLVPENRSAFYHMRLDSVIGAGIA